MQTSGLASGFSAVSGMALFSGFRRLPEVGMFLCLSIKRPVALRLVPIQTETKRSLDAGAIGEPRARTCRLARSTPLIGAVVDFHFVISTICSRGELFPGEPTSTLDLNVKVLDTSIKNDEVNAKPESQHQHYGPICAPDPPMCT